MGAGRFLKHARIVLADGKHAGRAIVDCELGSPCASRARIGRRG
jgi:hypothetical protein